MKVSLRMKCIKDMENIISENLTQFKELMKVFDVSQNIGQFKHNEIYKPKDNWEVLLNSTTLFLNIASPHRDLDEKESSYFHF